MFKKKANDHVHTNVDQWAHRGLESAAMSELLGGITAAELPDAVDMIMLGPSENEAGQPGYGFAHFAARLFSDVGASHLRSIAASNEIDVIRLSSTGLFWMRFQNSELSDDDLSCVLAAEAAMNRLVLVSEAFEDQLRATCFTEADCARADKRLIETIADQAIDLARGIPANPLLVIHGTEGVKGGEWDVRTRFAIAVERLRMPFRLSYTFDTHVGKGLFSVDYLAPQTSWMPQRVFDSDSHTWQDRSEDAPRMAARYALSIAAVLAAVAFGTSVGICRVRLTAHELRLDADPKMRLYIDRLPFISEVLPKIASGDESWMAAFIDNCSLEDAQFDASLEIRHIPAQDDMRPIPNALRDVLCADTVQELDVLSTIENDPWESVRAADADREDAPLAAIAVLEDVAARADDAIDQQVGGSKDASSQEHADTGDHLCVQEPSGAEDASRSQEFLDAEDYTSLLGYVNNQERSAGCVPLYCSDAVGRVLVSEAGFPKGTRFLRYSDAGFQARSTLCDLYRSMNDYDRALQQAGRCIELAPTSAVGYIDASNALLDQNRFAEAIPYLEHALSVTTHIPTLSFIYYRLAFSLWQSGRPKPGLACYAMSMALDAQRFPIASREAADLMNETGLEPIEEVDQAKEILRSEGIAIAPVSRLAELVAAAAIPLVDQGILSVCAPLVQMLGSSGSSGSYRDELYSVATSLRS